MREGHPRRADRDNSQRRRASSQRPRLQGPALAAVIVAVALPTLGRVDVGFGPGEGIGRRAIALAVIAALAGCCLLPGSWPRRLVELAAVSGFAAAGLHSVALTLLLSVLLVEAVLPRLTDSEAEPGKSAAVDTALGLVIVSVIVALGQRPVTPAPGAVLQAGAIVVALAWPAGMCRLGHEAAGAWRGLRERRQRRTAPLYGGCSALLDGAAPSVSPGVLDRTIVGLAVFVVLALPTLMRQPDARDLLADPARQAIAVAVALLLTAAFLFPHRVARWLAYGSSIAVLELVGWRTIAAPMVLSVVIVEAVRPVISAAAPAPTRRVRRERWAAAGALAGLAVVVGMVGRVVSFPAQLAVMAVGAMVLVLWPDVLTKVSGLVRVISVGVAVALLKLLGGLVWALFILVPWAFDRLAGWDPTFAPRTPESRLVPRHVGWTEDRRSWIPRTSLLKTRRVGPAVVRLAGIGMAALLLAYLVVTQAGVPLYWRTQVPAAAPAAMAGSPWWTNSISPEMAAFERGQASAYLGLRLADVRSEHTNVVDGRRVTWQPPAAPAARVWVFGGSTVFGVGQRDDHTIPSELARAAWEAGLAVEVVNFGVHGDVHWMEVNRLRDALASGLAPPDVVIFYNGWNDLVSHRGVDGGGSDQFFRGTLDPLLADQRVQGSWFSDLFFPDTFTIAPRRSQPPTPQQPLEQGISQYLSSVQDTLPLARARDLTTFTFLQPMLATRRRPVEGEPAVSAEMVAAADALRRTRPDDVIDLTAIFDQLDEPIYWDEGHTNELGARVAAGEIFRSVEASLRSAAAS